MKDQESEWISVSDLMTSIIAVMVIFIIVSLRNTSNTKNKLEETKKELLDIREDNKKKNRKIQQVDSLLKIENLEIKQVLQSFVDEVNTNGFNLVRLDPNGKMVIFDDGVFHDSSPCLTPSLKRNLDLSRSKFLDILQKDDNRTLLIEGYTDIRPFRNGGTINCSSRNYFINNNVELSVFRAQETRNVLTNDWDVSFKDRVIIAGYGSTKQDPNLGSANKRVTISIVK